LPPESPPLPPFYTGAQDLKSFSSPTKPPQIFLGLLFVITASFILAAMFVLLLSFCLVFCLALWGLDF
jgi:hypothetical protein